jgi:hypothetical protein
MTQELVDKFKAYAEERRKEREASTDRAGLARKRLQEIGYLDKNGEVSKAYSQEVTKTQKKTKAIA